jgi:type 1 glutamine amidotransferase
VFDAPLVVEDAGFPGMAYLPGRFTLKDEIYQLRDYSRSNVRVLLRLDATKIDLSKKGVKRTDNDFAVMWARDYGKGRVLYNGLGHQQEVWDRADIQKMWIDQVQWAMGLVPGDATPRTARAE